jgi:hypothetical protein
MREEKRRSEGLADAEARSQARREFGNASSFKESYRDLWTFTWLEMLRQDLRYSIRIFRKNPGFAIVAVLSLALGIGANTAIFSLIDAVMLRMLPVKHPEELVLLSWTCGDRWPAQANHSGHGWQDQTGRLVCSSLSYPTFKQFRDHSQVLSGVFGFAPAGKVNLMIHGEASLAEGDMVTGRYFTDLGLSPALGRTITEDDEKPGAPLVAVISHGYWTRRFGQDGSVIGKSVTLNRTSVTIVGVAPHEFFGVDPGRATDILASHHRARRSCTLG